MSSAGYLPNSDITAHKFKLKRKMKSRESVSYVQFADRMLKEMAGFPLSYCRLLLAASRSGFIYRRMLIVDSEILFEFSTDSRASRSNSISQLQRIILSMPSVELSVDTLQLCVHV